MLLEMQSLCQDFNIFSKFIYMLRTNPQIAYVSMIYMISKHNFLTMNFIKITEIFYTKLYGLLKSIKRNRRMQTRSKIKYLNKASKEK